MSENEVSKGEWQIERIRPHGVSQTLVGTGHGPFPRGHGNCMTLGVPPNRHYYVANMSAEDFEEFERLNGKLGEIEVAVYEKHEAEVTRLGDKPPRTETRYYLTCFICDERVPEVWFKNGLCGVHFSDEERATLAEEARNRGLLRAADAEYPVLADPFRGTREAWQRWSRENPGKFPPVSHKAVVLDSNFTMRVNRATDDT